LDKKVEIMDKKKFLELRQDYKTIIFDYGGIFVDINYEDTVRAFSKLTDKVSVDELYSKHNQIDLFSDLEIGKISADTFCEGIRDILKIQSSNELIKDAWCAMLKDIKAERVEFLQELKETKQVFMLSNINAIHEKFLADYSVRNFDISSFYTYFDHVYFSHHVKMRKPNTEIFAYVLEENKLNPKDVLFLDDSLQHVEGARKLGINAIHLENANTFIC